MTQPDGPDHLQAVSRAQDAAHPDEFDYDKGSPHLRHTKLRTMVEARLTALVQQGIERSGSCKVLEVGAGHGTFTRCLLDAGAVVTVTETSSASAEHLRRFFGDSIEVRFDETGEGILGEAAQWDMAVMTSVVHHIPDYLSFLERLAGLIVEGGTIFTVQDPLYYPRMSAFAHRFDRAAYYAWRLAQGNYGRGIATQLRRSRGVYLDTEPSDLVEYHVVRDGVDEEAIQSLLVKLFDDVEIFRYWSSQAPAMQRLGAVTPVKNTFGVEATRRRR
ncbi:MAG: methyltransferase domain-containing protein [Aeromicrobium sp.]